MSKPNKNKADIHLTNQKIFVLDTSVILYDHLAYSHFKDNYIAIPSLVLEELDNFKNGNDTRNFEARHFIRLIEQASKNQRLDQWFNLGGNEIGKGIILLNENPSSFNATQIFGSDKFDHRILNSTLCLKENYPSAKIVLVSKDICLRIKAKALGILAEDYETGKIKNVDELYTGHSIIKLNEVEFNKLQSLKVLSFEDISITTPSSNHYFQFKFKRKIQLAYYSKVSGLVKTFKIKDIFKIIPRNAEQEFALHALLNTDIRLISLQGNAGTGKTLLALASALSQRQLFRQIYITRPTVPLSNKEIGFLPGDAKDKVDPFMAPIWDNLSFIREKFSGDEKMISKMDDWLKSEKIVITPLAFIRGRTLNKIFFIVDEAQNLTPHEIKTIISRAGENTKIVFTGDIYQIDTPYLDAESNGLTYLIESAKEHPLYAHINLRKGERSDLANLANELL
ncbi:MAG: PhoH family protein [Pedobacter sp.]|nr:MAG: PhoH family protein [Pedobacter sp.]